jgi:pyridoxal 5'-phosphate synthase pdxT subunit
LQNEESKKVGVLALQGGFKLHIAALQKLNVEAVEVRNEKDLLSCRALILPGGESTTNNCLLTEQKLKKPLIEFAKQKPLFGTCAGLILMAKEKLLPITILRNAYGRQSSSFKTSISAAFSSQQIEAVFIRAPRIESIDSNEVEVLARYNGEAVLVRYKNYLGSSFHPELTDDLSVHRYFLGMI